MEVEDVGDAVLTELYYRSLFQEVKEDEFGNALTFKMHDLVHDLARSVMEAKHGGTESNRTMMLGVPYDQLTVAFPIIRMRGTDQFSSFLSKCGSLRALIIRSTWWGEMFTELPHAISKLKHLRHVNLSGSDIVELPNSICDLWNLQILNLNDCDKLRSLPKGMRFLRNLRHLCLQGCWNLTHMPSGIGKLTCLRMLSMVVLSGKNSFQLSEMRDLNMLRGILIIRHLERIETKKDAKEACLIKKQSLRKLHLCWDSERTVQRYNDEEVLEALKPCPNLQFLHIEGFNSSSFPSWMSTVTKVAVDGSAAEYIVGARESTAADARSPSLKQLELMNMPNLKGMLGREVQGTTSTPRAFSQLQSLSCFNCPTLTLPLPRMPSLKELYVENCPNMAWASISNLTSLNSLKIKNIEGLSCLPKEMLQNLSLLESLQIRHVRDLRALPRSLASLTALKELIIWGCPMLKSLPEEVKRFPTLQVLDLRDFPNLTSLPNWFGDHLTSLQHLTLHKCPKLETLPSSIQMMTTFQSLTIGACDLLEPRCEEGGEEWHKIKHIHKLSKEINIFMY
ncbi:putative disease resistance protein RGA1 [Coffea eugenioides]|uniref:putative disease resistance protein RGA1 n=1 Tax=Coffea eugenioides TaxID=49369 RepID=UPI000F609800|nr:putative disease resistance protein RGA1 [Coffea eugenioides]